jgi:hypothetical protein
MSIEAVNVMVKTTRNDSIVDNCRRRFQAITCFETPNERSGFRVKTIKVAVR